MLVLGNLNNKNKMKKNINGCGVQCVAKVTGKTPSKIREMVSRDYINDVEIVSLLKKLNYKVKTPIKQTVYPNKKYIATVPSLNNKGDFHYVVIWCKKDKNGFALPVQVFDPVKAKNRYVSQSKKKLSPNEFVIRSWTSIIEVNVTT